LNEQLIGLRFDSLGLLDMPGGKRLQVATPELLLPELRPDVLVIARRAWEDRLRAEYVGVMIMRRFHGLLVDLNAPMDLQELALGMMFQEQQHTRYCAVAASALGSQLEIGFSLAELQQARDEAPLPEQTMAMIVGTFLCGEGTALELLKHSIAELPKNGFSQLLRLIVRDEVLHAGIGVKLLSALRVDRQSGWLKYPGDRWVLNYVERQTSMMKRRDVVEPDEAKLFEDPQAAEQLRALGIADSRGFLACYHQAIDEGIPKALAKIGLISD
jgi:hypothetical protein